MLHNFIIYPLYESFTFDKHFTFHLRNIELVKKTTNRIEKIKEELATDFI